MLFLYFSTFVSALCVCHFLLSFCCVFFRRKHITLERNRDQKCQPKATTSQEWLFVAHKKIIYCLCGCDEILLKIPWEFSAFRRRRDNGEYKKTSICLSKTWFQIFRIVFFGLREFHEVSRISFAQIEVHKNICTLLPPSLFETNFWFLRNFAAKYKSTHEIN